jgi:hypothetical protein
VPSESHRPRRVRAASVRVVVWLDRAIVVMRMARLAPAGTRRRPEDNPTAGHAASVAPSRRDCPFSTAAYTSSVASRIARNV